jgi:hypothetical protein
MPEMTAEQAANLLAAACTAIEAAGIEIQTPAIWLFDGITEVRASCGWTDGEPWVVLHPGQRTTPNGIAED